MRCAEQNVFRIFFTSKPNALTWPETNALNDNRFEYIIIIFVDVAIQRCMCCVYCVYDPVAVTCLRARFAIPH